MDIDKIKSLALYYFNNFNKQYPPKKMDTSYYSNDIMNHVMFMCKEMQNFDDFDKLNRWLGFIQGVFSSLDVYTIDELRGHNK